MLSFFLKTFYNIIHTKSRKNSKIVVYLIKCHVQECLGLTLYKQALSLLLQHGFKRRLQKYDK